jgi:Putative Actinobacterial Holin-X, holin superfamily III
MATDNRSLAELMGELSRETATLVRKELELATTELSAKTAEAGRHVAIAASGGALVHAGLLVFLAALVIALTEVGLAAWLAALLVAALTTICGYLLMRTEISKLRQTRFAPTHTIESIKESTTWTTRQGA